MVEPMASPAQGCEDAAQYYILRDGCYSLSGVSLVLQCFGGTELRGRVVAARLTTYLGK